MEAVVAVFSTFNTLISFIGVNVVGDLHFVDSRDGKPSGICYLKIKAEDKRKAQRLHLDTIGSRYIEGNI